MSNRASDRARAEARRRARLAARGELPAADLGASPAADSEPPRRGGLLSRLFPPAPPLPNRPDPLAGYHGTGPLRPITVRLFLLGRNPLAWLAPGLLAFAGFFASFSYATNVVGLLGTFVLFGALIGAGWFGWQRPTLYGTAAALLAFFVAMAIVLFTFAGRGAGPETFGTPLEVISGLLVQAAYQSGLGFLGGWYGGYLRRRQASMAAAPRRRR